MLIGVLPAAPTTDGAAAELLRAAGCARIVAVGEIDRLVAPGDVVLVGRLADLADRADLGEGLAALVAQLAALAGRGIGFRSLAERLDSAAADGAARLALALARQGRAPGAPSIRRRGRPPSLDGRGRARARALLAAELPADQVAALLGVSRATLYRHLRAGPGAGLGPRAGPA